MSYAKLFSSIIHSTIWREPAPTKVVWITMLAMANRKGMVQSSVPGLADAAKVTLEECISALSKLSAADPWSRTKEYEGRRIQEIEGGWLILNYEKHRTTVDQEDVREKARERARRSRAARVTEKRTVTPRHASSQKASLAASPAPTPTPTPEIEKDVRSRSVDSLQRSRTSSVAVATATPDPNFGWSKQACDDWIARFGGTAPGGQIGKTLEPLVNRHGWPFVRKAWISYLGQSEAQYASSSRFAQTFGKWAGLIEDPERPDEVAAYNERELQKFLSDKDEKHLGSLLPTMPKARS